MAAPAGIKLDRLSYVIYEHPDLESFLEFSNDFGFENAGKADDDSVFLRGYGLDQYIYIARPAPAGQGRKFVGSGFTTRSEIDFKKVSELEGAHVVDISFRPGGGKMILLTDTNGFEMQIIYGQQPRDVPARGLSNVYHGEPNANRALDKIRRGTFNRMEPGTAKIHKLGHFGYMTDNYYGTIEWYTNRFNFKATDIVYKSGDFKDEIMSFFHLDLGSEYVDHHCLLVARRHGGGNGTNIHHSSFEVEDMDTQMMGHQWLHEKGYKLMWGVGRHVMGSQIFDYWFDPTGFVIEHYADGDVVNEENPTVRSSGTPAAIWGPPLPTKWD